jgi:hypothetical protein
MKEATIINSFDAVQQRMANIESVINQLAGGVKWAQETLLILSYTLEKGGCITKASVGQAIKEMTEKAAKAKEANATEVKADA